MNWKEQLDNLRTEHENLLTLKNEAVYVNGVYERYKNPVLTAAHAPIEWRYELDEKNNPFLMERIGIHAVFNSGAIKWNGKYLLVTRVEADDRKSFFAVAESPNGVDNFRFWPRPITMPRRIPMPLTTSSKLVSMPSKLSMLYAAIAPQPLSETLPNSR